MPEVLDPAGPATCPFELERAVMMQRWEELTFLHWRYDAAAVQAVLPSGLDVETCDGSAWVGLVPFLMRVGVPRRRDGGALWFARFCETNVRTYVRDETGRPGLWFFSLDAADLSAVLTARATYRLPYYWSDMTVVAEGDQRIRYTCRRRWPGRRGTRSRVTVEVGPPYEPDGLGALDHFLTARWRLFSAVGLRRRSARAAHPPWPLHRATAVEVDDELVIAAGLPRPTVEPLVHYSPGVSVRIGPPERAGAQR